MPPEGVGVSAIPNPQQGFERLLEAQALSLDLANKTALAGIQFQDGKAGVDAIDSTTRAKDSMNKDAHSAFRQVAGRIT